MSENLNIAYVQFDIKWEDPEGIRTILETYLSDIKKGEYDLLAFPEMFTTGFSMDAEKNSEPMDGPSIQWMKLKAQALNCVITGSIIIKENGNYYNRLIWAKPNGEVAFYDKYNLFTLAKEDAHFTKGEERKVFEIQKGNKSWRICPLICYDLRFPVWSRNTVDFDVLLYVANFPAKRTHAWSQLLIARAIENECYVIGVNRTGEDGVGIDYTGYSAVIDYAGYPIIESKGEEGLFEVSLDYSKRKAFCKAYNFLNDCEQFELKGI